MGWWPRVTKSIESPLRSERLDRYDPKGQIHRMRWMIRLIWPLGRK